MKTNNVEAANPGVTYKDMDQKKAKQKLGIAIVGLGKYSTENLMPALTQTQECYLAAIVTETKDKAEEWKIKYNIPDKNIYTYQTFDSIKYNRDVDVIYVVLPNSKHKEFVIRAADAGKHVICEKPMAITVEDCDKMITACSRSRVFLSIGYRLRFEPYNRKMMELGVKKIYGDIKKLTVKNGIKEIEGWRLDKNLSGGGSLMDMGVYCIQAVRYITGMEPVEVKAKEGVKTNPEKFKDIEESLTWQMKMPDGLIADCACSYTKEMNLLKAEGEKGWFELSPAFAYEGIKGKTSDGDINLKDANQQIKELDAISSSIKENKPSEVPGEMGRQDVKIIQAIYTSMKNNKWVKVE